MTVSTDHFLSSFSLVADFLLVTGLDHTVIRCLELHTAGTLMNNQVGEVYSEDSTR